MIPSRRSRPALVPPGPVTAGLIALLAGVPLLSDAAAAQSSAVETVAPGGGRIDGRRILPYTHAWQSFRVDRDGLRRPMAVWYDTVTVVAGGGRGGDLLRRVQWIVPDAGPATMLLNEADRVTLLPMRTLVRQGDAAPSIDLRFEGARVTGRRPVLPHNATLADQVPARITLELPEPAYDWRWWGLLIAALPLGPDYAARFLAVATEANVQSPLIWITARVSGEEAMGGVPCWVVEVQAGAPWTLWISKDRREPPVQRIRIEQPDGDALVWEPYRLAPSS